MKGTNHMQSQRTRASLALFTALAIVAVSCGGSSDDGSSESSEGTDAASTNTDVAETDVANTDVADTDPDTEPPDTPAETMQVGLVTTLSGGGGYIGQDILDGMQLALDLDDTQNIEIQFEDDGQDVEQALQATERLIDQAGVDLMTGIVFSNILLAVLPEVVDDEMIYISPNAGPSQLAGEQCNANFFNTAFQNDGFGESMGAYLNEQGVESVYLLAPDFQAGYDMLTGFKRNFEGEISGEVYTEVFGTDFAAVLAELRTVDTDGLFIFYPGGPGIAFLQQYAESGIDLPIYSTSANGDETISDVVGAPSLGILNSAAWSVDLDNAANTEFVDAFSAAYDRTPTGFAAQGYDTGRLLVSALAQTGGDFSDIDALRAAIAEADFDSVRGEFTFGTNQFPVQSWYVREVIEGDTEGDYTNMTLAEVLPNHVDAYADQCSLGS